MNVFNFINKLDIEEKIENLISLDINPYVYLSTTLNGQMSDVQVQ